MKYAFMSFSAPELSLERLLQTARDYGYDGVEPRLDSNHAHGVEVTATQSERMTIREQSKRSGIPLVCLASSIKYADPESSAEAVRQTHERIDLAGDLGVPRIRVFGGRIGGGLTRDGAVNLIASALSSVADHAAERGVTL